ncbi:MAG: DUF1624 domain-containing protein [Myxococcales bacterium]|nr:DUF1624 domain-containing protein [Myxococcales bacterium]
MSSTKSHRLGFVDTQRGVAVLLMMLWHSADSWIAPDMRSGFTWSVLRFLGGMAAPSFVFLAGAGVGLKLAADEEAHRDLHRTSIALAWRGAEIMALGYLLRLQFWAIDSAGFFAVHGYFAWIPLGVGFALLLTALGRLADGTDGRREIIRLAGGLAVIGLGYAALEWVAPGRLARVLRVDVLQAIGASLTIVSLLAGHLRRRARTVLYFALGVAIPFGTSPLREVMPGPLPEALAGYVAAWSVPPGTSSPTLFPLFPWLSYAFIGAAVGAHWFRIREAPRRTLWIIAFIGLALAIPVAEWWSFAHRWTTAWPWIVQPGRVLYRIGVVLALAPLAYEFDRLSTVLHTFGRTSLFVYWVHLEFTFGVLAAPLKKSLNLERWFLGFALLVIAMHGLAQFRLGPFKRWWESRRAT